MCLARRRWKYSASFDVASFVTLHLLLDEEWISTQKMGWAGYLPSPRFLDELDVREVVVNDVRQVLHSLSLLIH